MVHLSGNTSVVSKSLSDWFDYTGFPGDVCVTFFNGPPGNKMPWRQTPSRKKKAVVFTIVTTNTYQGRLNAGLSKVCDIFKVAPENLYNTSESFTHGFVIVATFPHPKK